MQNTLLAVPNVSEGRDPSVIDDIGTSFERGGARLVDVHADFDHHRSVFSLVGCAKGLEGMANLSGALVSGTPTRRAGLEGSGRTEKPVHSLIDSLILGAKTVVERVDLRQHEGEHPCVGALDVAPIVYHSPAQRGLACAVALLLGERLATELALPVLLYGDLGGGRSRADIRRGGPLELQRRIDRGEIVVDYGPSQLHPTAGAVLVTARPPLVAFNVELDAVVTLEQAKHVAALIRDGGQHGLPGVRALGVRLAQRGVVQVSTNIEDSAAVSAGDVVRAVQRQLPVVAGELVGLAPRTTFEDFPHDIALHNFDPDRSTVERAIELCQ